MNISIEQSKELEMVDMSTKIGGVILKKAEMENDFEKVYLKIFERMVEVEVTGGDNFLEILGEVGG